MKLRNAWGSILTCSLLALVSVCLYPDGTEARITRIIVDRAESPTFKGAAQGKVGAYEKIVGRAQGELDPNEPLNAVITDIHLAPRNSRGKVEYETDFYLLKPVDMKRSNGLLYYNVVNRGGKGGLNALDFGVGGGNDPTDPGDGLALRRGYSFLWSGWQADVLPGEGRMTIRVPIARTQDGSEITAPVRAEFVVNEPASTLPLASGFFTRTAHSSYETASLDTAGATLTVRSKETDPRETVPNTKWAFADCAAAPFPGQPSPTQICLQGDFQANFLYELIYTAKNPAVLGIGFAATRDLISFFRHARADDSGTPNPLVGSIRAAIMEGSSQSGRYMRSFLDLGFNQDEASRMVVEGMNPHIATGRIPVNVRFGQPGRGYLQHEEHLYPAHESPFTWASVPDEVAGRAGGLLDRCEKNKTCPKIIQTVSSTEYWQGRMALNTTDAYGRQDIEIPSLVRVYHFAGTQHGPAGQPSRGICQQLSNPNQYRETRRALLVALERWVLEGVAPPPSQYPTLQKQTLVSSDKLGWPAIPGVKYSGLINELALLDYGPEFHARDESGILTEPPVATGRRYVVLMPKVDADGNEVDGVRSATLQAPLGTYTGWNLRRPGHAEDELCGLQGSFIPFATTRAEREKNGDPRLSLEERYRDHAGYVNAVKAATKDLAAKGFLLPEDAARLVSAAERSDVLQRAAAGR